MEHKTQRYAIMRQKNKNTIQTRMRSVRACVLVASVALVEIVLLTLVNVLCALNYALWWLRTRLFRASTALHRYRLWNEAILQRLVATIVCVLESVGGVRLRFSGDADFFKRAPPPTALLFANHVSHLGMHVNQLLQTKKTK